MKDGDFDNYWWFETQMFLVGMESAALFLSFCPACKTNFTRSQRYSRSAAVCESRLIFHH
jgi:hypothetical protein